MGRRQLERANMGWSGRAFSNLTASRDDETNEVETMTTCDARSRENTGRSVIYQSMSYEMSNRPKLLDLMRQATSDRRDWNYMLESCGRAS